LIALGVARAPAHAAAPTFAFFQPTVVLTAGERKQLERGEPLARVIPGEDREVAVFAAMKTTIDGDRLLAWVQRIEALKKNSYVLASSRISETPRLEDLKGLTQVVRRQAVDALDHQTVVGQGSEVAGAIGRGARDRRAQSTPRSRVRIE
jgi:hypothetical protein